MAPRNNDPSTSYKRNFPPEDNDIRDLLPCILHKKHKVVKLVKSQIRKIRKEGFICDLPQHAAEEIVAEQVLTMRGFDKLAMKKLGESKGEHGRGERSDARGERHDGTGERSDARGPDRGEARGATRPEVRRPYDGGGEPTDANTRGRRSLCWWFTLLLLEFLLLVTLMVYISAGPLSNTIAHTPVPLGSFVRTEKPCFLEKKYLLRWSRPELLE